ncbi:F0F1 ATP synthase subunit delta [Terrarubrum flagellatum]|uniref:F0F1 ATP synthase subunit delta n=1 Tax=Terrirubrum flagellatum TaxID=2895980 RepID=UPI00314504B9
MAQGETIVSGVAGRYAQALFDLAQESKSIDAVKSDLEAFDSLVAQSPDLQRLVRSPVFTAEEQTKAIGAILDKAGIKGLAANFLRLVATQRRLFAVRSMVDAYRKLADAAHGVVRAEVTVAEKPSDSLANEIKKALSDVAGKNVTVDLKVDPAIIGGIVVKMGSRMVDSSLRTKLNGIKVAMKEVG